MPQVQAQRRLVKSPPELWTELSDAAALARHLGEFGEIRITRLEPESKVVWEGDRATGSVELSAAGWGTQVTLTVDTPDPEPVAVEPEPEPDPEPEPEPVQERAPSPYAATPAGRRSFFSRFFGRPDHVESVIEAARFSVQAEPELAAEPEPVAVEPEPEQRETSNEEREPSTEEQVLEHVLDQLGQAHHRPFSRA